MTTSRTIFVTGATATGKSDWALEVARRSGAVIINCDSIQVYGELRIGSNLPSEEDFQSATHLLYGFVPPGRTMDAGSYREAFFSEWNRLAGRPALVVGGTGFYFQALEKGLFDVPLVPSKVRQELEVLYASADGPERAWAELQQGDPAEAARLHPSDTHRVRRALELLRCGVSPSQSRGTFRPESFPGPLLKTTVLWERAALVERIEARTIQMLDRGLLRETEGLLARGLEDWAPLASVGYKQAVACLRGDLALSDLAAEISLRTRQLAKRQVTWFKRDSEVRVFDGAREKSSFVDACLRFFDHGPILGP